MILCLRRLKAALKTPSLLRTMRDVNFIPELDSRSHGKFKMLAFIGGIIKEVSL